MCMKYIHGLMTAQLSFVLTNQRYKMCAQQAKSKQIQADSPGLGDPPQLALSKGTNKSNQGAQSQIVAVGTESKQPQ